MVPDRLYLIAGTKLEHNDYTGFEIMPNVRAAWTPRDRHLFWAAVSRALRAPSRNDTNLVVNLGSSPGPGGIPILTRFLGNPDFQDEQLIAYEAGYRASLSDRFSLDLAAYFNDYHHLQSTEPSASFFEPTPFPPHEVQTLMYENLLHGETHGIEVAANWLVTDRWSLRPGYALTTPHMHPDPTSADTQTAPFVEGSTPDNSIQLRSHFDVNSRWAWDLSAYYVGALDHQGPSGNVKIPSYTRLDTGLTWKAGERFTISVVGQDLLKDHHLEFEDVFGSMQSGQVKRSVYAKLAWGF